MGIGPCKVNFGCDEYDHTLRCAAPLPMTAIRLAITRFLVYCGVGIRAYIACRMLAARGIRATNLSGGYTTYAMSKRAEAAGKAGAAAVQAAEAAAAAKEESSAGAHPAAPGAVSKSAEFELFYPHQRPTGSARVAQLR